MSMNFQLVGTLFEFFDPLLEEPEDFQFGP